MFGSAGSEITENAIYSRTRIVLGGINLVDYPPWEGDYTGLKVHRNSFYALGRYLKVGIVIGPASWSDDTDSVVRGAAVYDNSFQGDHFGYAIVVSSAEGFSVANNKVDSAAKFGGVPGARCPTAPPNGSPVAYLINRGSAKGTFQDEFVNGEVQHSEYTLSGHTDESSASTLPRSSINHSSHGVSETIQLRSLPKLHWIQRVKPSL